MRNVRNLLAVLVLLIATSWPRAAAHRQSPLPQINGVNIVGKDMILFGNGFEAGASVLINGVRQKIKDHIDGPAAELFVNPSNFLVVKKGDKQIRDRQNVTIVVQNPDGSESAAFMPTVVERILTTDDDGSKIKLRVNDFVFVYLGSDFAWRFDPFDSNLFVNGVPSGAGTLIKGAQGILKAVNPGKGEIALTGTPPCRDLNPPCEQPSKHFSATFVISE